MDAQNEHNEGADMDWPDSLHSFIFGKDLSLCGPNPHLSGLHTVATTMSPIRQTVSSTPLQATWHFSSTILYLSMGALCSVNNKDKNNLKSFNFGVELPLPDGRQLSCSGEFLNCPVVVLRGQGLQGAPVVSMQLNDLHEE